MLACNTMQADAENICQEINIWNSCLHEFNTYTTEYYPYLHVDMFTRYASICLQMCQL